MASFMSRTAPRAFSGLRAAQPSSYKKAAAPTFRRFLATASEQPRLRLGSTGNAISCQPPMAAEV